MLAAESKDDAWTRISTGAEAVAYVDVKEDADWSKLKSLHNG